MSEAPSPLAAPTGCVVLVFTDVEGSTSLWEADPAAMRQAIQLHNGLFRERLRAHRGYEVKTEGDAFMVAFASPTEAAEWCLDAQVRLLEVPWPAALLERAEAAVISPGGEGAAPLYRGLRVRMGLHLGTPDCVPDPTTGRMDYFGPTVNRAARVSGAAHGGQIVLSEAARAGLGEAPAGARLRSLGAFRLKGLSTPETLHEMLPAALAGRTFPPVRSQALARDTLPRPAHGCLGRDRELAELERLLESGERLLTLVGPGGIGKTRLAIELGWRLAAESEREAADIAFCDLTRATSAGEVAESVARAIGCAFGAQATAAALVELVGAYLSDRSGLVVILDNFEQLTPHGAETVGAWRSASPDTQFLVTSREPLGLEGETTVRLASLDRVSGVLLFVDRVSPEHRDAVLATANRPAVETLVDSLDGIPLALELAARRVGVLSVTQLVEQLSQRFRLLASRRRDLPARQATLRGTLDWSWNLLTEAERSALAQLSVFRGCSLEAAEQVLVLPGGDWVPDVMQALVERSMVQASGDPARFELLVSIREYAQERLEESGTAGQVRLRHARCYARLAQDRLTGAFLDDDRVPVEELEAERDNLAAAFEVEELPADDHLRLLTPLCAHALLRRPLEDFGALVRRGERRVAGAESKLLGARALDALGMCLWLEGNQPAAEEAFERARLAAAASGDALIQAVVLMHLGNVHLLRGNHGAAEACSLEALGPARACGEPSVEARILGNRSQALYRQGRYDECLALCERERTLMAARQHSIELGFAESNIGGALLGLNRCDEALAAYTKAQEIFSRLGHFRFESMMTCTLAYVRVMRGEGSLALGELVATLAKARRLGLKWAIAQTLFTIGVIRLESGEGREALSTFEESLRVARESGDQNMLAQTLSFRGAAHAAVDEPERATADLEEARVLLGPGQTAMLLTFAGLVSLARGRLAARAGKLEEAQTFFEAACARREEAQGWIAGTLPPPVEHPGGRFVGAALPLLERALARNGLLSPSRPPATAPVSAAVP